MEALDLPRDSFADDDRSDDFEINDEDGVDIFGGKMTFHCMRDNVKVSRMVAIITRNSPWVSHVGFEGYGTWGSDDFAAILDAIALNKNVTSLGFEQCTLVPVYMEQIVRLLTTIRPDIIALTIRQVLEHASAELFASFLEDKERCRLQSLFLWEMGASTRTISFANRIADALTRNTSVTKLFLARHWLYNDAFSGVPAISALLQKNTTITDLTLRSQCLTQPTLDMLKDKLMCHPSIRKLSLARNIFRSSPEGKSAVADIIRSSTTLTELDIDDCNLNTDALRLIADALKHNTTLRILKMMPSDLPTSAELELFRNVLKTNLTLRCLNGLTSMSYPLARNAAIRSHRYGKCRSAAVALLALKRRRLSTYNMVAGDMFVYLARVVWSMALDAAWGKPDDDNGARKKRAKIGVLE
jgi:hypothetical protein